MTRRAIFLISGKTGPELQAGEDDCLKLLSVFSDLRFGGHDESLSPPPFLNCANQGELVSQLINFFAASDVADQRIVYFTGHGKVSNGQYGFSLNGGRDFLPFSVVTSLLTAKGPGKTTFILDTCHSGAAEMGGIKSDGDLPIQATGSCVFASSKDIEISHEVPIDGSLFTHYLCECIATGYGGLPTTNGVITVPDAAEYVRRKIKERSDEFLQTPLYSIRNADSLLWLAKNVSGATVKAERAIEREGNADLHGRPCLGAALTDLDDAVVRAYGKSQLGSDVGSLEELSVKLDLMGVDSVVRPSEAAILCFGSRPERFFPSATSVFSSGDLASPVIQRQPVTGPLTKQFQELFQMTLGKLRREGRFGAEALREDDTEIPALVVREVISNAVAHRKFDALGRVHVHVADDHVKVSNPGQFPSDHPWSDLLERPGESLPPNRRITNFLEKFGGYEGIGRGFSVLHQYRQQRGADAVRFEQSGDTVSCLLLRPRPMQASPIDEASLRQSHEAALAKYVQASAEALSETLSLSAFGLRDSGKSQPLIDLSVRTPDGCDIAYPEFRARIDEPGAGISLSGSTGSGKTWLLRRLAIDLASAEGAKREHQPVSDTGRALVRGPKMLPVFLPLRTLRSDLPLITAVAQSCGIDGVAFEYALRNLHVVLLLDGLDEMPLQDREPLLVRLQALREEFPTTSAAVSFRPGSQGQGEVIGFDQFELLPASDVQIEQYLRASFPDGMKVELPVNRSDDAPAFKNPLLLSMFALLGRRYKGLPPTTEAVIEAAIDTLLFRHDQTKAGFIRSLVLEHGELREILDRTALTMTLRHIDSLPRAQFDELVRTAIVQSKRTVLRDPTLELPSVVGQVLDSGLFQVSHDRIQFMHRAIREHLAAGAAMDIAGLSATEMAGAIQRLIASGFDLSLVKKVARHWVGTPSTGSEVISLLQASLINSQSGSQILKVIEALKARVDELGRSRGDELFA